MAHDASMSAPRATRSLALLLLAWLACTVAAAAGSDPPGRVAQVNLVEGSGSMQASGTTDWSSELLYRPLATGDRVWIDSGARAEMHVGSTVLRLGSRTELQVLAVDDRTVRLAVVAGSVVMRVRSLDADEHYELDTPAGDVVILQPGSYRLDVDENERRAYLAVRSGWAEVTARSDRGACTSTRPRNSWPTTRPRSAGSGRMAPTASTTGPTIVTARGRFAGRRLRIAGGRRLPGP